MADFADPMRLRDLLDSQVRRVGMESGALVGRVWQTWPHIVGADIAAHAEPTSLRQGVLRVRADSPAWSTELSYLADDIRRRINIEVAAELVREVRVWSGPGRIARPTEGRPKAAERIRSSTRTDDPLEALGRAQSAWWRRRRSIK